MESYIVSARKYRPTQFSNVVGQRHITDTLKNAIKTNQIAHAYLFSGPRGVGKTTCARIFAMAVNCENLSEEGEPCNQCPSCLQFSEAKTFNIFELDAASNNSVEDIRALIETVKYKPTHGKYNVYIIDEVHMLSTQAFNAFLKTLEEPPTHAIFILATTEKQKILPTILSRCQQYDFKRIPVHLIVEHLKSIAEKEQIQYDPTALELIAARSEGSLRDALSIFDQISTFSQKNITYQHVIQNLNLIPHQILFQITQYLYEKKEKELLQLYHQLLQDGYEPEQLLQLLFAHFRNLYIVKVHNTLPLLEAGESLREQYLNQANQLTKTFLLNGYNLFSQLDSRLKFSNLPTIQLELALLKLLHIDELYELTPSLKKKSSSDTKLDSETTLTTSTNYTHQQKKESHLSSSTQKTPSIQSQSSIHIPPSKSKDSQSSSSPFLLISPKQKEKHISDSNQYQTGKLEKRLPSQEEIQRIHQLWLQYAQENQLNTLYDVLKNSHIYTNDEKMIVEILNPFDQAQIQHHLHQLQQRINENLHFFAPIQVIVKPPTNQKKQQHKEFILSRKNLWKKMVERNPALKIIEESGLFRMI